MSITPVIQEPGLQDSNHTHLDRPPLRTLQLLPQVDVLHNQNLQNMTAPYRRPMSNLSNGFLTMAERCTILNGPTTPHSRRCLNQSSSFLPNQTNPQRPTATRSFAPVPTYPQPALATLRDRLITLNPTEFIFQTFHPYPHLFSGTNDSQRIFIEVGQEREILTTGEEFQSRVTMIPQPPVNALTPDLNNSRFPNVGVNLMTSALTGALLGPDPLISTQMKIMAWNCIGARCYDFVSSARQLFV